MRDEAGELVTMGCPNEKIASIDIQNMPIARTTLFAYDFTKSPLSANAAMHQRKLD
jgi:hypothetical protein